MVSSVSNFFIDEHTLHFTSDKFACHSLHVYTELFCLFAEHQLWVTMSNEIQTSIGRHIVMLFNMVMSITNYKDGSDVVKVAKVGYA